MWQLGYMGTLCTWFNSVFHINQLSLKMGENSWKSLMTTFIFVSSSEFSVLLHNDGFCNRCITKRCLHNLRNILIFFHNCPLMKTILLVFSWKKNLWVLFVLWYRIHRAVAPGISINRELQKVRCRCTNGVRNYAHFQKKIACNIVALYCEREPFSKC